MPLNLHTILVGCLLNRILFNTAHQPLFQHIRCEFHLHFRNVLCLATPRSPGKITHTDYPYHVRYSQLTQVSKPGVFKLGVNTPDRY